MIERELLMDLRAEIMKIAREEVKKAIEEQTEPKRDESGSISCANDGRDYRPEDVWQERVLEKLIKGMALLQTRHGKWKCKDYTNTYHRGVCSVCGWESGEVWEIAKFYSYCPNCGADMREELMTAYEVSDLLENTKDEVERAVRGCLLSLEDTLEDKDGSNRQTGGD